MNNLETFHALHRFGLGPAPGEAAAVGDDPRAWLTAQIGERPLPAALTAFPSSTDTMMRIQRARTEDPEIRRAITRSAYREIFAAEVVARTRVMVETDTPFAERMVMFWSNHFTVSSTKRTTGPIIPAYEREVIRPHLFGRFEDMLLAAIRHPAMTSYLDNFASMGEASQAGRMRRARRGATGTLNENLAREVLELHTVGVNGGYDQEDVVELARILTGWSHGGLRRRRERGTLHGGFEFRAGFHEPGAKTVLGTRYREDGVAEGERVLVDLARHPATARHIATKLVRHFVADEPPDAAITRIARVFQATEGDLAAVARALVQLEAAWARPLAKVKSHYEFVIAAQRATGRGLVPPSEILEPLRAMGQVPFTAPSPQGWGDRARDWIAPEALMRRIEWARRYAATQTVAGDPVALLDDLVGPVAGDVQRTEVRRAPSADAALALVLASASFQRR